MTIKKYLKIHGYLKELKRITVRNVINLNKNGYLSNLITIDIRIKIMVICIYLKIMAI